MVAPVWLRATVRANTCLALRAPGTLPSASPTNVLSQWMDLAHSMQELSGLATSGVREKSKPTTEQWPVLGQSHSSRWDTDWIL